MLYGILADYRKPRVQRTVASLTNLLFFRPMNGQVVFRQNRRLPIATAVRPEQVDLRSPPLSPGNRQKLYQRVDNKLCLVRIYLENLSDAIKPYKSCYIFKYSLHLV